MYTSKVMSFIGQRLATTKNITNANITAHRIHSSPTWHLDQNWRQKKRLTQNPNAFGPLTNLPDYTYLDGRPTPFGVRQWQRIEEQRGILTTVKKLVNEIDTAVEGYTQLEAQKAERSRAIIDAKLKSKGQYLLTDENTQRSDR